MSQLPPDEEQPVPQTKAELLERIGQAWSQLEDSLRGLTESQMTTVRDTQGWTAKDHLLHVTTWEQSLLALLQGRNRNEAIGLGDVDKSTMKVDDINALIYQRNQHRSLDDVREAFRRSHEEVLETVGALSDEDLFRPYSHYQPNDPPYNAEPVIGWIIGNTYEHYLDHAGWVKGLVQAG